MDCPLCRRAIEVPGDSAGGTVRCGICEKPFVVPAGTADLKIEWGPIGAGRKVALTPGRTTTIGRARDNKIVLPGRLVSRHHARLDWVDSEWRLTDVGSGNGTFVDGVRTQQVGLSDESRIVIGEFALRLAVVTAGPSTRDTALEAMALDESTASLTAVAGAEERFDSRMDTSWGAVPLAPPDRAADSAPVSDRSFIQRWPVVILLAVLVVLSVVWVILSLE
ncbi:MAG: FHA domain-containing protein [Phycisphaerae bacterium]